MTAITPPLAPADTAPLPPNIGLKDGAALISSRFFPVSHRTVEKWPVVSRKVNGRRMYVTADLLAHAQAKLDAAPLVMAGA